MAIKITRYVDIISGVAGASSVAQRKLDHRRFVESARVPVGSIVEMGSGDADAFFGSSSVEAAFARQYFGYVSPAPASAPRSLQFAAYAPTGRAPAVFGGTHGALTALQAISSGAVNITFGSTTHDVTGINLAGAASLADVATALQAAIRLETGAQFTSATVTYDAVRQSFVLTGAVVEAAAVAVGTGTLAALLGWNGQGVILSPGTAIQTPLDAFQAAEQSSDSFGSASFGSTLTTDEHKAVAQYVAGENIKYQYYVQVTAATYSAIAAALTGIQSTGLILNGAAGEYKEAIPAAIMAATNYDRRGSAINYMYRQVGGYTADVTTDSAANAYDAARVNYYGQTASAGQNISFFQRGYLLGSATSPVDMSVHANEQWLKSYLTAQLLSLQLSLSKIPANNEGRAYILAQLADAVNKAKVNGTIIVDKVLTTAQQIAVGQITGDPDAWRDVQSKGFWADVVIVQRVPVSGVTEYEAQYTLVYSKGDVVRKVTGSHNLI
jgi:hypothetical protein